MTLIGLPVELPAEVAWLAAPWGVFAANWLAWILIASFVYLLSRTLVRLVTRRSATRIDDTLAAIVRGPAVILLVAWGFLRAWEAAFGASDASNGLERLYRGILIVVVARVVWRVLYEVILAHLKPKVEASGSQADDVIVPLLGRVGPVIIVIAVANAIVSTLGGNLSTLLASLGLLGLVLGYLFQEPLQGLFSGTYMALDNPFREDDLIILEDGTTCQVRKVGVRVTQLYDVRRHVLLYMPNAKLASNRIINLTKPSVELRVVQVVTMDPSLAPDEAAAMLVEACNAHENILGQWPAKEQAIRRREMAYRARYRALLEEGNLEDAHRRWRDGLLDRAERLEAELLRLQVEHALREHCEAFHDDLSALARRISIAEASGTLSQERDSGRRQMASLMEAFDDIIEQITVWLYLIRAMETELTDGTVSGALAPLIASDALRDSRLTIAELGASGVPDAPTRPLVLRDEVNRVRSSEDEVARAVAPQGFRDHSGYEDHLRLQSLWHRHIILVYRALLALHRLEHWDGDAKRSPAARLLETSRLFADIFVLRVTPWQLPAARLAGTTYTGRWKFELGYFVDDIVREHFGRSERVSAELLTEIARITAPAPAPMPAQ